MGPPGLVRDERGHPDAGRRPVGKSCPSRIYRLGFRPPTGLIFSCLPAVITPAGSNPPPLPMNDRDLLRQQRLERVQTFGIENQADWPADSAPVARYAKVSRILRGLVAARLGQQRLPVSKQTLLDALWLDFKNIARTARAVTLDEPGFAAAYRLPDDATESSIVTHADALLKRLEDNNAPVADGGDTPAQKTAKATLRAKFVRYLMPADFVTHLRADFDALDAKNQDKTADNLEGVESTKDINTLLEAGAKEILHLDAMMQNLYARDPGKLRAWHAASRVERSPRRGKQAAPSVSGTASAPQPNP